MKHQTASQDVEDAIIVSDSTAEAKAKARADLQAHWDRRKAAFTELPRNCTVDDLHAGLRERVALSVFGGNWVKPRDQRLLLPFYRDVQPLDDVVIAALLLFIRRHHAAYAGTLRATGKME